MWDLIRATEREIRKFRLLALVFASAGLYLLKLPYFTLFILIALLTLYFIYILLLPGFIINKIKNPDIIYGMIGIDALVIGCILYLISLG